MIYRIILFIILVIIEYTTLSFWFACKVFEDFFHFSSFDLKLRLDEAVNADAHVPFILTRIAHNKAEGAIFDLFNHYVEFWDIRFLINLLSIFGFFCFGYGLWYLVKKKKYNYFQIAYLAILVLAPFIEILLKPNITFIIKVILFAIPYQLGSFYGLWILSRKNNRIFFFINIILIFLSVWWLYVFHGQIYNFCIKP